jgi:hypothetical protein
METDMTPAQILWLALGIYPRDVRELVPQTVQDPVKETEEVKQ